MVLDQVVVTGFGGMAWWLGRVAAVGLAAQKPHVVYYEGDDTKVAIKVTVPKELRPGQNHPGGARQCQKGGVWLDAGTTHGSCSGCGGAGTGCGCARLAIFLIVPPVTRGNVRTIGVVIF